MRFNPETKFGQMEEFCKPILLDFGHFFPIKKEGGG